MPDGYVVVGYYPDRIMCSGRVFNSYDDAHTHYSRLVCRYRDNIYAIRSVLDPRWRVLIDPANLPEADYVNEDCPGQCSTEHAEPDPAEPFRCPDTNEWFTYCSRCGWEGQGTYHRPYAPTEIDGEFFCDPWDHGFARCDGCQEWSDSEDLHWDEWGDSGYCGGCNREVASGDSGETLHSCPECHTQNVHLCELTEGFLCDCKARAKLALRHPVKLSHELPELVAA